MVYDFNINYKSINHFKRPTKNIVWQLLIVPKTNNTQTLISKSLKSNVDVSIETSTNGFGFETFNVKCEKPIITITFEAYFEVKKKAKVIDASLSSSDDFKQLKKTNFKIDFDAYLNPNNAHNISKNFNFNFQLSIFENLNNLMEFVHQIPKDDNIFLNQYSDNTSSIKVSLFCALARLNQIPSRFVSGYHLQNQPEVTSKTNWVESFIPQLGWVGFDIENNTVINHLYIKIAHTKNLNDCLPVKTITEPSPLDKTINYQQHSQQQ